MEINRMEEADKRLKHLDLILGIWRMPPLFHPKLLCFGFWNVGKRLLVAVVCNVVWRRKHSQRMRRLIKGAAIAVLRLVKSSTKTSARKLGIKRQSSPFIDSIKRLEASLYGALLSLIKSQATTMVTETYTIFEQSKSI